MLLSSRLALTPIELSDLEAIHVLHRQPETDRFNTLGIPKDIHQTRSIIEPWILQNHLLSETPPSGNAYTFAIRQITDSTFIGLIALKLGNPKYKRGEIWYKLHVDFWGKGFATESVLRVLDFGFDTLHLHRIEAGCAVENIGSIKVLEKSGMTREGRKRQVLPLSSGWSDNFEYAILKSDRI